MATSILIILPKEDGEDGHLHSSFSSLGDGEVTTFILTVLPQGDEMLTTSILLFLPQGDGEMITSLRKETKRLL